MKRMLKPFAAYVLGGLTFLSLLLVTLFLTRSKPLHHHTTPASHGPTPPVPVSTTAVPKPLKISAVSKITPQDYRKATILDEIITTGNDNDPRLDKDLRKLSEGAKTLFEQRYQSLPGESLNERGTIVFLLGRNLRSEDDVEFLGQVLQETPCLSLASCKETAAAPDSKEDVHHEAGSDVTLAYPQLQSLKAFEAYLKRADRDPHLATAALQHIENAQQSSVTQVSRMAKDILHRLADNG